MRRVVAVAVLAAAAFACAGFTSPVACRKRSGQISRKVWTLGDSLTWGSLETSPNVYVASGGYRTRLYANFTAAEKARYNFVGTINGGPGSPTLPDGDTDGHPGWLTADLGNMLVSSGSGVESLLSNIPTWSGTIGYFDIAVLMIGTNSIRRCYSVDQGTDPGYPIFSSAVPSGATVGACWSGYIGSNPSTPTITAFQSDVTGAIQHTADEVSLVVDALMTACNNTCLVIVVNIPPVVNYESTIAAVNARLSSALIGRTNVSYITTPSITTADLTVDGVHLSATGYEELGDYIYGAFPP